MPRGCATLIADEREFSEDGDLLLHMYVRRALVFWHVEIADLK